MIESASNGYVPPHPNTWSLDAALKLAAEERARGNDPTSEVNGGWLVPLLVEIERLRHIETMALHVANLRALVVRERRWLAQDPDCDDRQEALAALEYAVGRIEGLPENWAAVIDGVPLRDTTETREQSRATADVVAERRRQVDYEGWDAEHDDQYQNSGQMAQAAAAYALRASPAQYNHAHDLWPWSDEWWKPKDVRRDLVRAAALIIAEIERLDRHSLKASEQQT
jgi:hypothetical protein